MAEDQWYTPSENTSAGPCFSQSFWGQRSEETEQQTLQFNDLQSTDVFAERQVVNQIIDHGK